jgi:hypothetical protein
MPVGGVMVRMRGAHNVIAVARLSDEEWKSFLKRHCCFAGMVAIDRTSASRMVEGIHNALLEGGE